MAGALPRLRRRRLGRVVASRHPQQPAAARHDGGKDPAHRSRPGRTSDQRARSATTAATAFRTTTRSSSTAGARKEIWASGFRNPHRLHWAIDPANPRNNRLIANSIGLRTWETVNIVHRGANYGYSLREGNEVLQFDNKTTKRPEVDRIPVQIGDTDHAKTRSRRPIRWCSIRTSPAAATRSAAAISIRARAFPRFAASTCSPISRPDASGTSTISEMLAADDGNADTMAPMHEIALRWDDPNDKPDAGKKVYPTMFPIAQAAYHFRGGKDPNLPGQGDGVGRRARRCAGRRRRRGRAVHLQQDRRHD